MSGFCAAGMRVGTPWTSYLNRSVNLSATLLVATPSIFLLTVDCRYCKRKKRDQSALALNQSEFSQLCGMVCMSDYPLPSVRSTSKRFGYVASIVTVIVCFAVWLLLPIRPNFQKTLLAEGTTVVSLSGSKLEPGLGFPHPPLIHVDGEFLIAVPESAVGLTIESRLFKLSVDSKTALRIVARSREAGERVQVLYGHVTVAKNYQSSSTAPDQLGAGEISMVNRSIDLMEKETLKPAELHALREAFRGYGIVQTAPT
jgi:hypothetical protein